MTVSTPLGKPDAKHKGVLIWDKEDADRFNLSGKSITIAKSPRKNTIHYHARFSVGYGRKGRKLKALHNFIMWSPDGCEIDHKNGNGLDNRKSNLRIVNRSENIINKAPRSKHGVVGITYNPIGRKKKWKASIKINKKTLFLGCFLTKEDAVSARVKAEKENNIYIYRS